MFRCYLASLEIQLSVGVLFRLSLESTELTVVGYSMSMMFSFS